MFITVLRKCSQDKNKRLPRPERKKQTPSALLFVPHPISLVITNKSFHFAGFHHGFATLDGGAAGAPRFKSDMSGKLGAALVFDLLGLDDEDEGSDAICCCTKAAFGGCCCGCGCSSANITLSRLNETITRPSLSLDSSLPRHSRSGLD